MPEFYIVTRYFINVGGGTDGRSQQKYDDLTQAKKAWHQQVASDIDKNTILWELIQIVRSRDGMAIASEIIDNYVAPAPEPTPNEGE